MKWGINSGNNKIKLSEYFASCLRGINIPKLKNGYFKGVGGMQKITP